MAKTIVSTEILENQIKNLNEQLTLINTLRQYGITKADAEAFNVNRPCIKSGYNMGETNTFWIWDKDRNCNVPFLERDNRQDYAKSCKWGATHGDVQVYIKTKADLKKFVKACINNDDEGMKEIALKNLEHCKVYKNDVKHLRFYIF